MSATSRRNESALWNAKPKPAELCLPGEPSELAKGVDRRRRRRYGIGGGRFGRSNVRVETMRAESIAAREDLGGPVAVSSKHSAAREARC